jgi:hypothetical protein
MWRRTVVVAQDFSPAYWSVSVVAQDFSPAFAGVRRV